MGDQETLSKTATGWPADVCCSLCVMVARGRRRALDDLRWTAAWWLGMRKLVHHVLKHAETRKIAVFLALNLSFMLVEAIYGLLTNSLGLISDAAHMLFDCVPQGLMGADKSRLRAQQLNTIFDTT